MPATLQALPSPFCIVTWKHPSYGEETTVGNFPIGAGYEDEYTTIVRRLTIPEVLSILRKALEEGNL